MTRVVNEIIKNLRNNKPLSTGFPELKLEDFKMEEQEDGSVSITFKPPVIFKNKMKDGFLDSYKALVNKAKKCVYGRPYTIKDEDKINDFINISESNGGLYNDIPDIRLNLTKNSYIEFTMEPKSYFGIGINIRTAIFIGGDTIEFYNVYGLGMIDIRESIWHDEYSIILYYRGNNSSGTLKIYSGIPDGHSEDSIRRRDSFNFDLEELVREKK